MERGQHQDVCLAHTVLKLLGTPHWENKTKTNYLPHIDKCKHLEKDSEVIFQFKCSECNFQPPNAILMMFTCINDLEK